MSKRIDDIIDGISGGLQSSTEEAGYIERNVREGVCWRCTVHDCAEGSELCAGCRSFLLEDSENDPRAMTTEWSASRTFMAGRVNMNLMNFALVVHEEFERRYPSVMQLDYVQRAAYELLGFINPRPPAVERLPGGTTRVTYDGRVILLDERRQQLWVDGTMYNFEFIHRARDQPPPENLDWALNVLTRLGWTLHEPRFVDVDFSITHAADT